MTYDDNAQFAQETTYWEKIAETKWGTYITNIENRAILKACELAKDNTTALEIGCDGGRWSKLLTDLGWSMICTDIDNKTIKICKIRIPTAKCILVNPNENRIPCVSESVRLLLCIEVAQVIQANWFIDEAFRVLQNKGFMVGVFWNLLSFRGFFAHMKASFRANFNYYKLVYPCWRRKLSNRGFTLLYEEGYCWFPFARDSNSPLIPYFAWLEKKLGLNYLPTVSPFIVFIAQKVS